MTDKPAPKKRPPAKPRRKPISRTVPEAMVEIIGAARYNTYLDEDLLSASAMPFEPTLAGRLLAESPLFYATLTNHLNR